MVGTTADNNNVAKKKNKSSSKTVAANANVAIRNDERAPTGANHSPSVMGTAEAVPRCLRKSFPYNNLTILQAVAGCFAITCGATVARAQQDTWNDPRTLELVQTAIERRAGQFVAGGLRDYRAEARGYLTFLAQVGEGFPDPPRVVKIDELAVDVLWAAPGSSKQLLRGRRDTLLLPAEVRYYRSRFGIVQNNFPDLIRMGDAQDVRDVPHPLSTRGLGEYDFAIRDSLRLRLPDRTIDLYEVHVRPRDETESRVVGAVYLDRVEGTVARMSLTFTRAALLDPRMEVLSILLENSLVGGRYWLPSRQEVEVVRTSRWLDFPARGIIRARWELCCYELNVGLDPSQFRGAEITFSPPETMAAYSWAGSITDGLPPDVLLARDEDARRALRQAEAAIGNAALTRARTGMLSAGRISDVLRLNRVEGVAVGAGGRVNAGGPGGVVLGAYGRFGFADRRVKGRLAVGRTWGGVRTTLFAERAYREVSDEPEVSLARNTIGSGLFGKDLTNPYDIWSTGIEIAFYSSSLAYGLRAGWERQDRLRIHASSLTGAFDPPVPAWSVNEARVELGVGRGAGSTLFGAAFGWRVRLRGGLFEGRDTTFVSAQPWFGGLAFAANTTRSVGRHAIHLATTAGAVTGSPAVPPQELVWFGGPVTGPGYGFHEFGATVGLSQRIEWRAPVPFPSIGLGRYGRTPASATVAPFVHAVAMGSGGGGFGRGGGFFPSAGVAVELFFDLVRIQAARGTREGRWTFSIDVTRQLWSVL